MARHGTAMLIATAVFVTRRSTLVRQAILRRRAEERERAAEAALAEVHTANAQRMKMQRAMQAAQRRESLGLMAGGIAHDFNNLLTVITGNLDVAREGLDPDSPLAESLADADAAADHAARLTRQMLAYAGRAQARTVPIALGTRAREVVRMLASSLPSEVELRLGGNEADPVVAADSAQLDQVLINLLQNAVDACRGAGGRVEVDWGVQTVDPGALPSLRFGAACVPGRYAYFEVRDDGLGMEASVAERMFEPFFTTKDAGSGLGLAAVEGIAEQHRAALVVSSAPGVGTTVRFLIPHDPDLRVEARGSARSHSATGGMVLLVDDEEGVRRVARAALERLGYTVREARDGAAARDRAGKGPEPHAAVLDLTMPGTGGYELARELRDLYPALPIVLMSGFDRDEVMAVGDEAVRDYVFLAKPFTRAELAEAVEEAVAIAHR